MTPNETHPRPNSDELVPIGNDSSPISNSHENPVIQVFHAEKNTSFNTNPFADQLPVAIRKPATKRQRSTSVVDTVTFQSIRILLIVKRSDVGFEWLHDELIKFDDDTQRSKYIKRFLLSIATGVDSVRQLSIQTSTSSIAQRSYRISFSLSNREVGLEKLFKELSAISSPSERNLHVKRILFNSRTTAAKASPVITKQLPEVIAETALTVRDTATTLSPWSKSDEPLGGGMGKEEKEKNNARKRMASVMSVDD